MDTTIFGERTGRHWEDWLAFLESIGARELTHAQIAQRIAGTGDADGWWAQTITVAYEQHIGRRQAGQRSDGAFEVAVSRTLSGTLDEALSRWLEVVDRIDGSDGVAPAEAPSISGTEKWRYWRCALANGHHLTATIGSKGEGKSGLTITHARLAQAEDREHWRAYWKAQLASVS